jgi:hypothetical protein
MKLLRLLVTRLALFFVLFASLGARAAVPDAAVAKGKRVLFVYNQSDLEKARAAVPAVPARIEAKQTQRNNDTKLIAYLGTLGFVVTPTDEYSPAALAGDQDLVVISETVSAVEIGPKYRETAVPLVAFENDLLGDLGMTADKAGLAAGNQNVLATDRFKLSWGRPVLGSGATVIATLRGEPEKAAIFAYEKGATMADDRLAPARRVMFFLDSDTFEQLRPEGLALLRAALLWAVAKPD